MPSVTFPVADFAVAAPRSKGMDVRASVESLLQKRLEAFDLSDPALVCCEAAHPFAQAAHDAFFLHYPLVISPDDVWFCLAQGFAHHVNLNAEKLRHRFVSFEGKKKLVVSRPDFVIGGTNPWPEVFTAFSDQIAGQVGEELRDLVVADFSTTTHFHRAATEVTLMDAFQAYFEYEMLAGCGIPSITLRGAPDDWRNIRRRAEAFAGYGLEEWVAALLPVLDQMEAASRGFADRAFWNSYFRYLSGSGATALTGWIQVFFPYLKNFEDPAGGLRPNPYLGQWKKHHEYAVSLDFRQPGEGKPEVQGPTLLELPAGLASAPVKVVDLRAGVEHPMRFVAGMFGVSQDRASSAVSPSFGWAVVHDEPSVKKEQSRWSRWLGRD